MRLKILVTPLFLHRSIAPRLGIVQLHRFVEQFEALHLLDRLPGGLYAVENNESLTSGFQVGFSD